MSLDDDATAREEMDRELALQIRKPELPHIGICYNCQEELQAGCYYDADCRNDHQRRTSFNKGRQ